MSQKAKILLTGSTGMVGKNILESSFAKNYEIISPSSTDMNLLNVDSILNHLDKSFSYIIHAAGIVGGIQANINNNPQSFISNLEIGLNLMRVAKKYPDIKFLNLGSSCMYPRNSPNPLKEEFILNGELEPTNKGYALAKIVVGMYGKYSTDLGLLNSRTLIPCNLFGRYDSFSPSKSHLLPSIIRKVHDSKSLDNHSISIWGDGSARREFMYAGDLANIIFEALEIFDTLPSFLNVGIGCDYSILEYYECVCHTLGIDNPQFVFDKSKPVGMKQKLVDNNLQIELGLASHTTLEDAIRYTYDYYLSTLF